MEDRHRYSFTPAEIEVLRQLLRDKMRATPDKQKGIRAKMRRMGFYITKYQVDQSGFTAHDLDRLIERGVIAVVGSSTRSSEILKVEESPSLPVSAPHHLVRHEVSHAVAAYEDHVPDQPGLYCLRIRSSSSLPQAFAAELARRNSDVIYIGLASQSLRIRLGQELRARGHGTFFRSIGAALGYLPPCQASVLLTPLRQQN